MPVAFSGVEIVGDSAKIFEDMPQLHVICVVTFLCFSPNEGQLIRGVVNNTASDSVGLLVLNTFNASITAEGLRGYVHNVARGVWHREDDEDDEIQMGQELEFMCIEMKTHDRCLQTMPLSHPSTSPPPSLSPSLALLADACGRAIVPGLHMLLQLAGRLGMAVRFVGGLGLRGRHPCV